MGEGDWIDTDLTDEERQGGHIQFRAWRRFMQGAEWLSSAEFIVLDRLHGGPLSLPPPPLLLTRRSLTNLTRAGHIVSLVLGIPHILINNNIGKLSDYYTTWTKDCPLGTLVLEGDQGKQGIAVQSAYSRWVQGGKVNGRDFVWW